MSTTVIERPVAAQPAGVTSPLPTAKPEAVGLDRVRLERLCKVIEGHIAEGRCPGAQIAIARHGHLAAFHTFGDAHLGVEATDDTLWLLYSETKIVTAAALWQLVDNGALSFADRVADHLPEFAHHGKGEVTVFQLLSHQGGFPSQRLDPEVWTDHQRLRRAVCEFTLEWTPGSRIIYHAESAHCTAAVLIEAVTGRDYREVIRLDLLHPVGIRQVFVGVPPEDNVRCADMYALEAGQFVSTSHGDMAAFRAAGVPSSGGYATAAGMAAFYQMLLAGGVLNGVRVLSPRVIQYATRNHCGDRPNDDTGIPSHWGMTPTTRGTTPTAWGLGTIAPPRTFGHGGMSSSFSWGDPDSGLSFSYLSNAVVDDPWASRRLDQLSNIVQSALVDV